MQLMSVHGRSILTSLLLLLVDPVALNDDVATNETTMESG
jgi:hypothetical protein